MRVCTLCIYVFLFHINLLTVNTSNISSVHVQEYALHAVRLRMSSKVASLLSTKLQNWSNPPNIHYGTCSLWVSVFISVHLPWTRFRWVSW